MGVQEQSLIGRPEITPIRMLLADDSDMIRRVLFVFLEDEPLIEIVGEAKDFTELLEKALALKPRIVLMDLHMRDKYKFKPEFVRSELQASAEHVLAMSRCYNDGRWTFKQLRRIVTLRQKQTHYRTGSHRREALRVVSGASMLESLTEPLLSTKALWRELSSAAWRPA